MIDKKIVGDICPIPFELGEKNVTNECMDGDLVEECEMGSGSEELIGSWCSCADSSEEVEGEGDRQEDMLRIVESNLCGNDWIGLCELGAPNVADNKEETEQLEQEIMQFPPSDV